MRYRSAIYKLGVLLAVGLGAFLTPGCGDDPVEPTDETGKLLYVANSGEPTISVIDTLTNTVTATLPLEGAPARVVRLHPFRSSFYAPQPNQDRVIKLLQRDASVIAAIPTQGRQPWDLAFSASPDAALAFVSLHGSDRLDVLRLAEDRVLQSIPVGRGPGDVALDLTGRGRVWVVNETDRTISVIDLSNNTVGATITSVREPRSLLFRGSVAYVSDASAGAVQQLRLGDFQMDPNAPALTAGRQPEGMAAQPDTNNLLVANRGDNTLLIIDLAAPETRTSLPTGAGPTEIIVNAAGTRAYVANTGANSVTVVDLGTKQVLTTVTVGAAPRGMALF